MATEGQQPPLFSIMIWEAIAKNLKEPSEVHKLALAIPELEKTLQRQKELLQFNQIIPLILPRLTKRDVLVSRTVCKDWNRAVDKCLERSPRAYDNLEESMPETTLKPGQHQQRRYLRPFIFGDTQSFINFKRDNMDKHPMWRNPIVGRAVYITFGGDQEFRWHRTMEFFKRFGHHIWHLEVKDSVGTASHRFCVFVMECLRHLPNLKGLSVTGKRQENAGYSEVKLNQQVHFSSRGLSSKDCPKLEQLGTLRFFDPSAPTAIVHALVTVYPQNVRRLVIHSGYWKMEYSDIFPNLCEFVVMGLSSNSKMSGILLSLDAPLLRELNLTLLPPCRFSLDDDPDVFQWLLRFPKIQSLSVTSAPTPPPKLAILPLLNFIIGPIILSLKHLHIPDFHLEMDYDYLECFPSLEHLHLDFLPKSQKEKFDESEFNVKIRNCIVGGELHKSNVWELLPNLKDISLPNANFDRRAYDRQKKLPDSSPALPKAASSSTIPSKVLKVTTTANPPGVPKASSSIKPPTLPKAKTTTTKTSKSPALPKATPSNNPSKKVNTKKTLTEKIMSIFSK